MRRTPLYPAHLRADAKMVEFAGFDMPVQYPLGLAQEHLWTRRAAGLFDVSHMGQLWVQGSGSTAFLSRVTPTNFAGLEAGRAKYTLLLNEAGGVQDDLIVTHAGDGRYFLVVNASRHAEDLAWLQRQAPEGVTITPWAERALLALQGPQAELALQPLVAANLAELGYMRMVPTNLTHSPSVQILVSRLGYTGEDGFEISLPAEAALGFWNALVGDERVEPIGLGARDTLRLEMGYPLYGHDLDETTSPIEAGLGWVVSKDHRDFVGAERILAERANGVARKRIGIELVERGVAREGCLVMKDGTEVGRLTSGGMSPSLSLPMAQGYLRADLAVPGTPVEVVVRGKTLVAQVVPLSRLPARTKSSS